jgi:regulator of protease activity HflC (stomatin/prohibitin superfamily)
VRGPGLTAIFRSRPTDGTRTHVTAVEIKDIVLPDNMQRAMAKEAEAERERRAKIVAKANIRPP